MLERKATNILENEKNDIQPPWREVSIKEKWRNVEYHEKQRRLDIHHASLCDYFRRRKNVDCT
jgi:hypothetical protein